MVKLLPLTFNYKVETRILPTFPRYGYICKSAFSYTSTLGVVLPAVVRMLCIYPLQLYSEAKILTCKILSDID